MKNIAIFASGNGSNFEKIMENIEVGYLDHIHVTGLYTDQQDAFAIERARRFRLPVHVFNMKRYDNKEHYETAILKQLHRDKVEWLVLAGYMKLVGPTLLNAYADQIINIHPSILPSFPGKNAVGQALRYGCRVSGATVHYVDSGMDTGKIIDQMSCPIYPDDTEETLQLRIQNLEYELYPRVIKTIIS
ncbi:phosphoribosylglycinamide formyltransferase [Macrococcus equipercicus]|uniref:Phosphoribosylglycinamide formyltransferase n=1 Tax=Macrococcus equipercicus TaxID=69967 RepID=A0A9Q9BNT0_9STAP|nr:phosphoribosylglycinamide formyltransferase [Macrococcus equipercicus]KAA1042646.1 phosphoribosylglycinamide formyltransferase [Macrococcus equipercicus]UTH14510.1 phosphoribosylglycinamide formyltransferase [Macrococcus equipercicus]